jgi:hypothetical protein
LSAPIMPMTLNGLPAAVSGKLPGHFRVSFFSPEHPRFHLERGNDTTVTHGFQHIAVIETIGTLEEQDQARHG